jgi:hypothetical protein
MKKIITGEAAAISQTVHVEKAASRDEIDLFLGGHL